MQAEKKIYDLSYLESLSDGDQEFTLDMLREFIRNTPDSIQKIKYCTQEQDWIQLCFEVHKFIPTLAFVGFTNLNEELDQIYRKASSDSNTEAIPDLVQTVENRCKNLLDCLQADFNL